MPASTSLQPLLTQSVYLAIPAIRKIIRIYYLYSANGTKLAVMLQTATSTYSRYYMGGFLYEGEGSTMELTEFSHPEGRVRLSGSTYAYDYTFRDHNHNVRAMFTIDATGNAEPIQTNSYYPMGMRFNQGPEYRTQDNDRLFGGKELQAELNLSTYDFGWRQYNPALGRWYNPDPMEEKYHSINPYNFTMNNPVNLYDPDGRESVDIEGWSIFDLLDYVWVNTDVGRMTKWIVDDGDLNRSGGYNVVYSAGDGNGNGFVSLNSPGGGHGGTVILGNGNYDRIMFSPTYLESIAQSSGLVASLDGGGMPQGDWMKDFPIGNGYYFEAIVIQGDIGYTKKVGGRGVLFSPEKQQPNGSHHGILGSGDFTYMEIYRPVGYEKYGSGMFENSLGNGIYELNPDYNFDPDRLYFRWRNTWAPNTSWQYYSFPKHHPTVPSNGAYWGFLKKNIMKKKTYLIIILTFYIINQCNAQTPEQKQILDNIKQPLCYKYLKSTMHPDSSFTGKDTVECYSMQEKITLIRTYENGHVVLMDAFYDNGNRYRSKTVSRNNHESSISWYKNGNIKSFYYYIGDKELLSMEFYQSGMIKSIDADNNDVNEQSIRMEIDTLGRISKKFIVSDTNSKALYSTVYYPIEHKMVETVYNDGRQPYTAYYENGNKMIEGEIFQAGFAQVGHWQEWYEDGTPKREYYFNDSIPNQKVGIWKWYDENGNLIKQEKYKEGSLIE